VAPRSLSRPTRAVGIVAAMLGAIAAIAVACGSAGTPSGGQAPTAPPSSQGATVAPTPSGPPPSLAGRDAPPDAVLAADGGDPVTGQLGTFVWFDTASDAPWLPGARLRVGAGEPLTLRLIPDGRIATWEARYVPAAAQGPEAATALGHGAGSVAFGAPGAGDWTVEVAIQFGGGVGEAHYFWRLEVE
jgi:hypothetical protein